LGGKAPSLGRRVFLRVSFFEKSLLFLLFCWKEKGVFKRGRGKAALSSPCASSQKRKKGSGLSPLEREVFSLGDRKKDLF